jgi:hypothetical protein
MSIKWCPILVIIKIHCKNVLLRSPRAIFNPIGLLFLVLLSDFTQQELCSVSIGQNFLGQCVWKFA